MRCCCFAAIGAWMLGGTLGCSSLRSESDTCQTPGVGCSSSGVTGPDGGGGGPDWSCLGLQPGPIGGPDTVTYQAPVVYAGTQQPVQSLTVCVCYAADLPDSTTFMWQGTLLANPCNQPLTCFNAVTAGDAGQAIDVPITFPGGSVLSQTGAQIVLAFLTPVTVPSLATAPGLLAFNDYVTTNLVGRPALQLNTASYAQSIAALFPDAGTLDLTLGVVLVHIYDCAGNPAAGVKATGFSTTGPSGIPFTIQPTGPTPLNLLTSSNGEYGFVNVPPGPYHIDAVREDGTKVGSADLNYVRGRWGTGVEIRH